MERKSADNSDADTNENVTSRLCSERTSEEKCNADTIKVTNKDKDDLCLEYTQENICKTDEVDATRIKKIPLGNTPTLPNSISKVETTDEGNDLKLISQINQEKSAYECIEDSISATDTHIKSASHKQENIRAKYSLNILQNTQKGEGIADSNETTTKEDKEFDSPFQNKQEVIGASQVGTINEDKKNKLPSKTQDNVYEINDNEDNSNSGSLLQGKNEQNIDEKITPSEGQILQESGTDNATINLTIYNNKDFIDTKTGQRTNNETDVKTTINEDKELKLPSQNMLENVCGANKCEENNNPEFILLNKHEKIADENMTTSSKKLQENGINNETIDKMTVRNSNLNDLQRAQQVTSDDKLKTKINEEERLKLPIKNMQESIHDLCNTEKSKTSPTSSLQDTEKHTPKVYKNNIISKEDKLQLVSKDNQKMVSTDDKKKITINKENILKTFRNIKESIKQRLKPSKTSKFKNYTKRRKEKKEAVKREKEKLKNIPKTVQETQNNYKISEESEWFRDQYEKYIGMPKTKDTNPTYVLEYLRLKAFCRYVPEAKGQWFFKSVSEQPKDSVFLSSNGPRLQKCTCPDKECFCRGDIVSKAEKIPCCGRYNWSPVMYYFQWLCCFRMFLPQPYSKDFINKLVAITRAEEEQYQNLSKKGLLNTMAPEFCLMRCQHYKKHGHSRTIKYLPMFLKEQSQESVENDKEDTAQKTDTIIQDEQKEEDDRICNDYSCTVSSQTDTGPDGEIIVGKVTQFIFPSIKHSILSDLEGKRLQISSYEREYKSPDNNNQVNIQKIENIFNLKEMKKRLSKLISSIIEIKDHGIPVNTRSTQFPACGKFCEDFTGNKRSDTSGFEMSSLNKIKHFMKDNNVDDTSSCTCCKLYKESLNTNIGDN